MARTKRQIASRRFSAMDSRGMVFTWRLYGQDRRVIDTWRSYRPNIHRVA